MFICEVSVKKIGTSGQKVIGITFHYLQLPHVFNQKFLLKLTHKVLTAIAPCGRGTFPSRTYPSQMIDLDHFAEIILADTHSRPLCSTQSSLFRRFKFNGKMIMKHCKIDP